MSLKVQILIGAEFKAAADALRNVDEKLPGQMRKVLRRVAQPLMREQRKNIRNMPTNGNRTTGLRKEIAKGVRLRLRTSRNPAMRIVTNMTREKGEILPRGLDTFFGQFRGGPKAAWHWQQGQGPSWFMGPPSEQQRSVEKEIRDILQMSAQEIRAAAMASRRSSRPTTSK